MWNAFTFKVENKTERKKNNVYEKLKRRNHDGGFIVVCHVPTREKSDTYYVDDLKSPFLCAGMNAGSKRKEAMLLMMNVIVLRGKDLKSEGADESEIKKK